MAIYENIAEFYGLPVKDFTGADDWKGTQIAYRIRTDWDGSDDDVIKALTELANLPEANQLAALVIGMWTNDSQTSSEAVVKNLTDASSRFGGLRAIFLGDIKMEENEISWIVQTNLSPLLSAYPLLEVFRLRGASELRFTQVSHSHLKQLVVESGGMPRSVLRELFRCEFPNLEHLELWLGSDGYGWDGGPEDLQPLLSGKLFPKLRYLGLRNCEMIDELAPVIVNSPILQRIEVLDLSLGNLSDVGGKSLLALENQTNLEKLDLSHHYLTEELAAKIQSCLTCEVIVADAQSADDEWRSIFVSE